MLTIDRFEGNKAVCERENGEIVTISREQLPFEAKEGDRLEESPKGYRIQRAGMEKERESLLERFRHLETNSGNQNIL